MQMACVNHPDRDAAAVCVICGDELCAECRRIGPDGRSYCAEHVSQATADTEMPPRAERAAGPTPTVSASGVELPARGEPEAATAVPGESTGLAAACYFAGILPPISFILPLIPLISADMKRSAFMRYHAFNGLFWGLAVVVGLFVLQFALLISGVLGIPGILIWPLRLLRGLWWVVALVLSIVFAMKASNKQSVRIPLVSDLADSQAK